MSMLCCTDSMPFTPCRSTVLSAAEYDAIFEERQRRFAAYAARNLHRSASRAKPIVDPVGHEQFGPRKGKGAIGADPNPVLRSAVVLSDGCRRHRTVQTKIEAFALSLAGKSYVGSDTTGLRGTPPEGGADQDSATP